MRLVFVANARIPSEMAHPLQIMHMAAAFAGLGYSVRLIYPRRANTAAMSSVRDPFAYFGVRRRFGLVGLPSIDFIKRVTVDWRWLRRRPFPRIAQLIQLWSFAPWVLALAPRLRPEIVYGRDLLPLTLLRVVMRSRARFGFEAHTTPASRMSRRWHLWAARRMHGIVVITEGLRRWYLSEGVAPDKVLTAPDGVDLGAFDSISRAPARAELGLDPRAPTVCYLGHLYPWKGVEVLVEAARALPPEARVFIVGGISPDLERIRAAAAGLSAVTVTGYLPPERARLYLAACDAAVIPFTARALIAREHSSPLKLFEYMAAGCAIVASDLPALREVLRHESNGILVAPDDPAALARGITRVLRDDELAARIRRVARAEAESFTWERRAASIIEFLKPRSTA